MQKVVIPIHICSHSNTSPKGATPALAAASRFHEELPAILAAAPRSSQRVAGSAGAVRHVKQRYWFQNVVANWMRSVKVSSITLRRSTL